MDYDKRAILPTKVIDMGFNLNVKSLLNSWARGIPVYMLSRNDVKIYLFKMDVNAMEDYGKDFIKENLWTLYGEKGFARFGTVISGEIIEKGGIAIINNIIRDAEERIDSSIAKSISV